MAFEVRSKLARVQIETQIENIGKLWPELERASEWYFADDTFTEQD
jgi:hypothetical protein